MNDHRRACVMRINAKRPRIEVEVTYMPRLEARENLIELLLELVESCVLSGGR
jgi:hypothetical protein